VPEIAWRAGVDRSPLDPADPQDAHWLRCLVWPEHHDRAERLTVALRLAATEPPRVLRADFVDGLVELLGQVPSGVVPVVTHSAALMYAPAHVREQVRRTCRERGAWRLGAESEGVLDGLGSPTGPADGRLLVSTGSPSGVETVLALAQPHGRGLTWVAQAGVE
jgi:hypothetical protein